MSHFIHTASGGEFHYGKPFADIRIRDVAHHLSHENRFCGATTLPYSVAQHSLMVERLVRVHPQGGEHKRNLRLYALLHDAHEGFMGDAPTPFQKWFAEEFCNGVDLIELAKQELDKQILPRLGVQLPLDSTDRLVAKECDRYAFVLEARQLFWELPTWLDQYIEQTGVSHLLHLDETIPVMLPWEVRAAFINVWEELVYGKETSEKRSA
jgi:hypothetical protein